jgi:hypothetical protein
VLLMDLSISSKRNVRAFQATFFEMLSAWSASFLAGMTRISREMNHRACKERRRRLLPMRLRLLPSHSFRHSRFTLANRITSVLLTTHPESSHPHATCCTVYNCGARMALTPGTKLGPYEIQSSLGAVNAGIDCG